MTNDPMAYDGLRPFGPTGLRVSALCPGAMNFGDPTDAATSRTMINAAVDAGVNMFDVADVYIHHQ